MRGGSQSVIRDDKNHPIAVTGSRTAHPSARRSARADDRAGGGAARGKKNRQAFRRPKNIGVVPQWFLSREMRPGASACRAKKATSIQLLCWYSWVDSNHRPPDPQSGALNQLSYSCTGCTDRGEAETRRDAGCWQGPAGSSAMRRLYDGQGRKDKARATGPGSGTQRYATLHSGSRPRTQATLRNALVTPVFNGSAVSVATFWASAASSLVCSETVSNCLRAWAVDSSMTSENDFTSRSSRA
jgi:hypothetical protein